MKKFMLAALALILATQVAHAQNDDANIFCRNVFLDSEDISCTMKFLTMIDVTELVGMKAGLDMDSESRASYIADADEEDGFVSGLELIAPDSQLSSDKLEAWCGSEFPREEFGWSERACFKTVVMLENLSASVFSANSSIMNMNVDDLINIRHLETYCRSALTEKGVFGCINLAQDQLQEFHRTVAEILRTDPDASTNLDMVKVARWCNSQFPAFDYDSLSIICAHTAFMVDRLPANTLSK